MAREPERYRGTGGLPSGARSRPGPSPARNRSVMGNDPMPGAPMMDQDDPDLAAPSRRPMAPPQPTDPPRNALLVRLDRIAVPGIIVGILIETLLMILSLVPGTIATRLGWSATNGPFPAGLAPLITTIFYVLPALIGVLARRWEVALFSATFPAWIGLGIFTIASSPQNGIFALTASTNPAHLVGSLELFAFLGGFGWLVRRAFLQPPAH